jgi:hypothetical protein
MAIFGRALLLLLAAVSLFLGGEGLGGVVNGAGAGSDACPPAYLKRVPEKSSTSVMYGNS